MSIALGVASKGVAPGASLTDTTTGVATQASGSVIYLSYCFRSTSTFTSVADNKGNSANYVRIGTELDSGLGAKTGSFFCQNAIGGAGHTATINISGGGGSEITLFFLEIKAASLTAAFDQFNRRFDNASPFTSLATPNTTSANQLLVGAFWGGGANPIAPAIGGATPAGGWSINATAQELDGSSNFAGCLATVIVSATGAYEAGFTEASATDAMVHIATFAEAGSGVAAVVNNPIGRRIVGYQDA